ncbi:TetR/AcrR family transcriptional regulator [Nocardioides renjunii]|uniref:TetR/AcrR family transcriptional regulator n=1 Tax=Nocardioides renjunii TaxID=3095075 RepID=UPI002AFFA6AB|nr:helix-turn-helix domain-containing protein [Nocardioides sp. S-34]WQQ20755.1 helix-turn-helix domain-containing protein [Nocardioides sp. S-34]
MTRKYDAPRRAEQATITRAAIVEAAAELFAAQGYGATTVGAIATRASVSARSVYALGGKAALLSLALDHVIAGDDRAAPLVEGEEFADVVQADSTTERARLVGRFGAALLLRLYPLYRAFEQAAAVDGEVAALWRDYQARRRSDVRRVVEAFEQTSQLRPGLDTDTATDTVWALIGWHPVALLVEELGYDRPRIERWLEDTITALLIGSGADR